MSIQPFIPTQTVLNSPVTALRFQEQIFSILKWARNRESRFVCVANVHMLMEAYWNPNFASVLEKADLVTPDGMPLVWMLRKMGAYYQDRVAGLDIFSSLCNLASLSGIGIYFLGSQKAVLERMKERLDREFPDLNIAGMEPLPFISSTNIEVDETIVETINNSGAGLVFVCLGCPKQEHWMARYRGKIRAVMIGLGGAFPVYAGIHQRAPRYIRESGFEWCYRLLQEPNRLWQRYSQTIPPFIWLAFKQLLEQSQYQKLDSIETIYLPDGRGLSINNIFNPLNIAKSAKIGEILIRQSLISQNTLSWALEKQQNTGQQVGQILLQKRIISQPELKYYLSNQQIKLGELLLINRIISESKLNRILEERESKNQKIGELVVQKKLISQARLKYLLQEQYLRKQGLWLSNLEKVVEKTVEDLKETTMNSEIVYG